MTKKLDQKCERHPHGFVLGGECNACRAERLKKPESTKPAKAVGMQYRNGANAWWAR